MVVAGGCSTRTAPVTVPTPESIDRVVEPDTFQFSITDWPTLMVVGVAEKKLMTGGLPTAIETGAVVDPKVFVAVRA